MKKSIIAVKLLAVLVILIGISMLYKGISGAIRNHHTEESNVSTGGLSFPAIRNFKEEVLKATAPIFCEGNYGDTQFQKS